MHERLSAEDADLGSRDGAWRIAGDGGVDYVGGTVHAPIIKAVISGGPDRSVPAMLPVVAGV